MTNLERYRRDGFAAFSYASWESKTAFRRPQKKRLSSRRVSITFKVPTDQALDHLLGRASLASENVQITNG